MINEDEVRRIIQIINRRTKNNLVLDLGEPRCWEKTAIVEGLAQRMVKEEVEEKSPGTKPGEFERMNLG